MWIVLYRTVIIVLFVMAAVRIMGKRQIGELEPSELVIAIMISEMGSIPIADTDIPLFHGLAPIAFLLLMEIVTAYLSLKSIKFRAFVSGKPSFIIQNGTINQTEMKKNRITLDELSEALRKKNSTDISAIKYAILETNGELSIIPYAAETSPKNKSLNISEPERGLPVIVVNDGRIMSKNLKTLGLEEGWLLQNLKSRGVKGPGDVYLMTVDETGGIYLSVRNK